MNKILIIIYLCLIYSTDCFLFSVIISIYNTGKYLDDSITSIINQTIGFNKIQLILINDGSTDNSENICLKYKNLYEKNIIYIKINHSGVSEARNIGLNYAKGLYVNFLDSDDKWDSYAFIYAYLYFKLNKNINLIGCRIKCFESSDNYHFLDYKFKTTRKVNLIEEYDKIHLSVASSFFRRSVIKGKKFDNGIFIGEDARFLTNILLNDPILGFIRESIYFYRRRADLTSAIQNTQNNYNFYFWTIEKVHQFIMTESIQKYNKIIPFIQFYVAYDLLFRIKSNAYKYLDFNDYIKYCHLIEKVIKQIEDKYILEQKIFEHYLLFFVLSKKYDSYKKNDIIMKKDLLIYSNNILIDFKKYSSSIIWNIVEIRNNILHIEGEDKLLLNRNEYFYFCRIGKKKFFPKYFYYSRYNILTIYGIIRKGRIVSFDIELDLNNEREIQIYLNYKNNNIQILTELNTNAHLPPLNNSYYVKENHIIKYQNNKFIIYPYDFNLEKQLELNYSIELEKQNKEYIIDIRKKYLLSKNNRNKINEIWLINDSKYQAGDNGEYFFRYLNQEKHNNLEFYFVISKNCSDYERLKIFTNILDFNSSKYLDYFFKSDKIITSIAESWVNNPFDDDGKYLCDFYNSKLIYLRNRIINVDIENFQNKIKKNFDLIITPSLKEYKSFIKNKYVFTKINIALTGLPRFDNLKFVQNKTKSKKIILIFPTLRKYINGVGYLENKEYIQPEIFKNTTYFNFYNGLINDPLLLSKMKDYDYKGLFCLLLKHQELLTLFDKNKFFEIRNNCYEQEILIESSLLVTDFSNLFLDFGYIQKPIIYTHFDYHNYKIHHYYKGFFNYKKDGFGPICYDIKCALKTIISQIENNCKLKKIYLMRIKKYFHYHDELNSERTYLQITEEKKNNNSKDSVTIIFFFFFLIMKKLLNYNIK